MQGKDMKLEDWLDDLCVRFIINLPQEELISVERICFQVEEAQWFYEDFIRPLDPNLPSLSLKEFSMKIFAHCPLMSQWSPYHHAAAFSEFMAYKTRVPVRGAILLNEDMDKCVLVKGYKKNANWSFPRGKINKDEADLDCAIREVYEETGFDIREAGLLTDKTEDEYIEIPMREQNMRLYVIRGVSMDTHFEPRTRKEISRIEWYKISDLPAARRKQQQQQQQQNHNNSQQNQNDKNQHQQQPGLIPQNKFYMVAPFLSRLKRMIRDAKRNDAKEKGGDGNNVQYPSGTEAITEEEDIPSAARKRRSGAARTPALSEVPEVQTPIDSAAAATGGDPMATLKQVLNISGGGGDTATDDEQKDVVQPTVEDGEKSRTLLGLLRSGSASTTGTPPVLTTTQPPPQQPQQQQLPPFNTIDMGNFTPEQQQHMPPPGYPYPPPPPSALSGPPMHPFGPHVLPPGQQLPNPLHTFPPFMPPPGPHPEYNTTLPPPMPPPYPTASFPISHPSMMAPQLPNPLMPFPFAQPAPPTQNAPPMQVQPQAQPTIRSPLAAAAAPYQRTGDPQFAQSEQQRGIGGFASAIPSANKLPPPKLSSHSLGLLSVLRGEKESGLAGDGVAKSDHDSGNGNGNGNEVVNNEVQKGNAGEKNVGATVHANSNAAGDLLALLKRKPAAESGTAASATAVVAAANVNGPAQNQVQPQPRSQAQTQAAVLPVRPKEEAQARRKPQQQQQQATRGGGRTGAGGDRGNEAGFSDSGRRNGSANVRGGGAGAGRRGGMKTASTPDLGKRGRRDRERDFEKEREKMKMKNVTILTRPQSQSQQTPEKMTMMQSEASAEARRMPTPPQHPRKQQQQQQQQQPAQSRAKPQPLQPQRILKRPDPTAAAATAVPTSAEAPLIPAADSKRLPTETVPVGSFAKPAKYGRPAIPAEPVKVNEAPRIIQRRKIPTFDDGKEKKKELEREEDGKKKNQQEEGRAAAPEQKQRSASNDGQKETLLNLFARPAEKPQQDQGQEQNQKQLQASVSPAGANAPPGPSAPVADNKAFLLGYLNSVAKQGGSR